MAAVTATHYSSLDPIATRVEIGFPPTVNLLIAEFVIGAFLIEEFDQTQAEKMKELLGRVQKWPKLKVTNDLEHDYSLTLDEVGTFLAKTAFPAQFVKIAAAYDSNDLQGVLVYFTNEDPWWIHHLVSARVARTKDKANGAGTALMNHLIHIAVLRNATALQVSYRTTSLPFYQKCHFENEDSYSMVRAVGK